MITNDKKTFFSKIYIIPRYTVATLPGNMQKPEI